MYNTNANDKWVKKTYKYIMDLLSYKWRADDNWKNIKHMSDIYINVLTRGTLWYVGYHVKYQPMPSTENATYLT